MRTGDNATITLGPAQLADVVEALGGLNYRGDRPHVADTLASVKTQLAGAAGRDDDWRETVASLNAALATAQQALFQITLSRHATIDRRLDLKRAAERVAALAAKL